MKKCIQPNRQKKDTFKLRKKKHHVHMANQNNLHAKHKPSQHPHPLTFVIVHALVIVEITLQMA